MRISAKTEYACIAMFELAITYGWNEPVRLRTIAEEHGIPARFLVQILLQLKGAGLVTSTRGASGGYQLARPPDQISLSDVMQVVEGQDEPIASSASPDSVPAKVLQAAWRDVAMVERRMLKSISFADLVERGKTRAESMYYI